ncbi:hypothetical protein BC827DRAFT_416346 [Russula dissimulans]|nr:hypothetical protein BC827DRAFT_416346 [Russula dissimulans]
MTYIHHPAFWLNVITKLPYTLSWCISAVYPLSQATVPFRKSQTVQKQKLTWSITTETEGVHLSTSLCWSTFPHHVQVTTPDGSQGNRPVDDIETSDPVLCPIHGPAPLPSHTHPLPGTSESFQCPINLAQTSWLGSHLLVAGFSQARIHRSFS